MNKQFNQDSQQNINDEAPAASGDISSSRMSAALKTLITDTVAKLKDEAYRNGRGATKRKADQRAAYAADILATEGRAVRSYEKATPERRKAQKKASKDNRSPAQIEKDREADKLRKRAKVMEKKAAGQRDLEAKENFGKF
nr:hypothetical protein [uncultured Shinella sp.]